MNANTTRIALTLAVMVVAHAAERVHAQRTLRVPAQYPTIQAAIDAAGQSDTVLVAPGVYGPIKFGNKSITVKSSHGPFRTTIDGAMTPNPRQAGVSMGAPGATIEGFTIQGFEGVTWTLCLPPTCRGGTAIGAFGAGIQAANGAVIMNNIIRRNGNRRSNRGAGISAGAGTLIQGNLITQNDGGRNRRQVNCTCGGVEEAGSGGGIYGLGPLFIANNVITGNAAHYAGGVYVWYEATLANNIIANNVGTGVIILSERRMQITNNTIVGNTGSGIVGGAQTSVVNSIVRGNGVVDVQGNPVVTYSNIEGGYAGTGNFDADPQFVDAARGDYHLRHTSTSRDGGTNATLLPSQDFEGNARIVGTTVDVGADEFGDRLYLTGSGRPGTVVNVTLIGTPGLSAYWAFSGNPNLANPPLAIPGAGSFYLQGPFMVGSAGTIPPSGVVTIPVAIPATLPSPTTIPVQALIGPKLTNPWVQVFKL